MTDHYDKAVDHLIDVYDARVDLDAAHRAHASSVTVAALYDQINHNLKLADIHAHLAIAQRLDDARLTGGVFR